MQNACRRHDAFNFWTAATADQGGIRGVRLNIRKAGGRCPTGRTVECYLFIYLGFVPAQSKYRLGRPLISVSTNHQPTRHQKLEQRHDLLDWSELNTDHWSSISDVTLTMK